MKKVMKSRIAAALALALTTLGAAQARAGGWGIAGAAVGGLAAGAVIGATVADAAAGPVYYNYPAPYPAPVYAMPGPAVVVTAPRLVYGARPWVYGPYPYAHGWRYPYGRYGRGWGWGPRYRR